eukprot:m51a1_g1115 putative phosphoglycerate mutase family protein (365) ;mRNA; f:157090-158551
MAASYEDEQEAMQYRSNTLSYNDMPVDLVLVRHGESEGNLAQVRARNGDSGCWDAGFNDRHTSRYRLTDKGRSQAAQAGRWLLNHFPEGFDQHFCSEYVRAIETASCLDLPNALWTLNLYLREKDSGVFSGKPRAGAAAEVQKDYAAEKQRREKEQFYYAAPGGESIAHTCIRVDLFLQSLSQNCSGLKVVCVVHRNVMMAFRVVLERIPQLRFEEVFLKDPDNDMDNCHILHYSRRNPFTREIHTHLNWVRSLLPWKRMDKGWMQIIRPRFTSDALHKMVGGVPQIVNNTEGEMEDLRKEQESHEDGDLSVSPAPQPHLPASVPHGSHPIYINAHGRGLFDTPCVSPCGTPPSARSAAPDKLN